MVSELDNLLRGVIDWWMDAGIGLGEIKDRLDHLARCRYINDKIPGGIDNNERTDRLGAGIGKKIIEMKRMGMSNREITRQLHCSSTAIYNYAHGGSYRTKASVIKSAAEYI